jgi:hypothetical protein
VILMLVGCFYRESQTGSKELTRVQRLRIVGLGVKEGGRGLKGDVL